MNQHVTQDRRADAPVEIEEKVIVRRMPEPEADYGWAVSLIKATGRTRGKEQCLAMLCGGNMGKVLAGICAKQIADMHMIELIVIED